MNKLSPLVHNALSFACAAHCERRQERKYTGDPYICHPIEVMNLLRHHVPESTDAMLCAALLHDVVEDTNATLADVEMNFGVEIKKLVYWLTDISEPSDGNRAQRKAHDRAHIALAPYEAQTVKCADLISNTRTIASLDPNFAKMYMAEKRLLLDVLVRVHPDILDVARQQVDDYYESLN
jgi:(p)ppGpp synthase/HD superfamily hydrolase